LLTQHCLIALDRDAPDFPLRDGLLRRLQNAEAAHLLLVPLASAAHNLGVLVLGSDPGSVPFRHDEQNLVETMAGQIASAMSNARLAEQARQAVRLAERNRVARDLHDSAAQTVYSLSLMAGGWAQQAEHDQLPAVADRLTQLQGIALQVLKELRLIIYELRHPELAEDGLVKAIERRLAAVEQRAQVRASLVVHGDPVALPLECSEQVFAILQEALNNTLRHSQARMVEVRIVVEPQALCFAVQDDGIGFGPDQAASGLGLHSMRERAQLIGGRLNVISAAGQGALVELRIPLPHTR
jgi:signal transduction histidine kinase